ncbi:methyltransferase domain-containing protein [Flavobacterium gelidilacus]|uniref:methyltransferase domain-containing protein n=1 Tax=Flavobacterium gelidilacus TaxID=206041 RepID=UPI000413D441|nr:methyltransferase domain-containing protein [Flavobacterium gelidilacus]
MQFNISNIIVSEKNLNYNGKYWESLSSEFKLHLEEYLKKFEKHRLEIGLIPTSKEDWQALPFGNFAKDSSWKWRRDSLSIIKKQIKNKTFNCTLEIGPWNGWLSKYLAKKSNTVIACDYFVCPNDGIGNINELAENIIPIQCDIEQIYTSFKPNSFDFIVLNHNLSFMKNPTDYINQLKPLLTSRGIIISIGTTFFKNPENKIKSNQESATNYFKKHNLDLFIQPVKGYLDFNDKIKLQHLKFIIKPYSSKLLQNIYSFFNVKSPYYCYLIYKNND